MSKNDQTTPRRLPQFTLRTLLLMVTVAAVGLAWLTVRIRQAKRQQEAESRFIQLGASLGYDADYGNVTSIHFSNYTTLSDEDLKHVAALPYLDTLWLNLADVTGQGLTHLSSAPRLRELHLNADQISDQGIENLKAMPALKRVAVWGKSPQDASQIKKLKEALPDVEVR